MQPLGEPETRGAEKSVLLNRRRLSWPVVQVDAAGFNCGTLSLGENIELSYRFVLVARALSNDVAICAEPNAVKPELVDGRAVYKVSPGDFAGPAEKIRATGVTIIAGCCGAAPVHIEAVARRLKEG